MEAPSVLSVSTRFAVEPEVGEMSIHVEPVRVFPTPFTLLQAQQALTGQLDVNKWGRQPEFVRRDLMTRRDKEFVTKIQLNQMVAVSNVQNFRGQFTFGRSRPVEPVADETGFGKRLYSSVYHPRKLVSFDASASAQRVVSASEEKQIREAAERVFDLLLDVSEVDEYIATLHPLAEDKINEAIIERTQILETVTKIIESTGKLAKVAKWVSAKKRTIDLIVELLQPRGSSEAEARRSLIFRRVPEAVQGFYIDLLERIVGHEE